jgi:hypothetical protein
VDRRVVLGSSTEAKKQQQKAGVLGVYLWVRPSLLPSGSSLHGDGRDRCSRPLLASTLGSLSLFLKGSMPKKS